MLLLMYASLAALAFTSLGLRTTCYFSLACRPVRQSLLSHAVYLPICTVSGSMQAQAAHAMHTRLRPLSRSAAQRAAGLPPLPSGLRLGWAPVQPLLQHLAALLLHPRW